MAPELDFVYWRHILPIGIKVEEISGGMRYSKPEVRLDIAKQIYCENGREAYRELQHFPSGTPFLAGEDTRISLTHTDTLLAVATLPPTPEVALNTFDPGTALGIDAEHRQRKQILNIRERFLNSIELSLIPSDSVEANITAWTAKEALYKAALTPGLDWRENIRIHSLPTPMTVTKGVDDKPNFNYTLGRATVIIGDNEIPFLLFCYDSEENRITVAYTEQCAKFSKTSPSNHDK